MTAYPPRPPQITDWHLAGVAAVYPRQSSPGQVRKNVGSGMAQHNLAELLKAWGFSRIRVYGGDTGKSGTSVKDRADLQALMRDIRAGEIRVLAVLEIARLGRNHYEQIKCLGLAEWRKILIVEGFVVRNLRELSDWTTIYLQSVIADQESRRLGERIRSALYAKAKAGIPPRQLPAGYERGPDGSAVLTTDAVERTVLERVWRELLEGRTTCQVVLGFIADQLKVPARGPGNSIRWVEPVRDAILRIAHTPFYCGFLVVWKHRSERGPEGIVSRLTAPEEREWIRAKIDPYVTREEFERVQALLDSRNLRDGSLASRGLALCGGLRLLWCPRCDRPLRVGYNTLSHPRRRPGHYYVCWGPKGGRDAGSACFRVSGGILDRALEEIVLRTLRCPSPAALRQAIRAENDRRQAEDRRLAAQVRQAEAAAAEAESRLEESRARGKHPLVIDEYEARWNATLEQAKQAQQLAADAPPPKLLDTSPAFVGRVTGTFQALPRLWRDRLGPPERKEIVRRVVARIEATPLEEGTTRIRVILHAGAVLERVLYGPLGRRRLMEALAAEGRSPKEIVVELAGRGIRNKFGRPLDAVTVKRVLDYRRGPRERVRPGGGRAAQEALRALWQAGLTQVEIAERMNAQGLRTGGRNLWTVWSVMALAKRLGLSPRWEVHREALRGPLSELVGAGWGDGAIAEEFNARGVKTYSRTPWTASRVQSVRRALGIRRVSGARPPSGDASSEAVIAPVGASLEGPVTSGAGDDNVGLEGDQPGCAGDASGSSEGAIGPEGVRENAGKEASP